MLGYLEPGDNEIEIGKTVTVVHSQHTS
jgi:hypothetical protein